MFITLEGPEGSGKTSQLPELVNYLQAQGYELITTREPGGTFIGDQIRRVLTSLENTELMPRTEILLFLAARAQLVEQVIKPALKEGKIVICDRYGDSTLAYQGYGHRTDLDTLKRLLAFATGGLKPDLTIFLDLDVETGLQRKKNVDEWNRLDAYEVAFHKRVRLGYHQLILDEPERWVMLDASKSKEEVQISMRQTILERMKKHHQK
ncbi:MAG: dTMP kinase [Anaerolineaceae bacterium]|nr:dTMP kinase [Anaerolineaceae bacterium]